METFDDVRTPEAYNAACEQIGCQNFLEDYLVNKIKGKPNVSLIHQPQETLLVNSGLGVASNSEYYSVLPVKNCENKYILYFYTYNVDDRKINVIMKENGAEFYNGSFQIRKSNEFKSIE